MIYALATDRRLLFYAGNREGGQMRNYELYEPFVQYQSVSSRANSWWCFCRPRLGGTARRSEPVIDEFCSGRPGTPRRVCAGCNIRVGCGVGREKRRRDLKLLLDNLD